MYSCATRVITQHLQQSLFLYTLLLKCAHLTASIHRMCRFLRLAQFVLRLWCVAILLTCSVGRSRSGQLKNACSFHGCCHDAFVLMRPRDDNKMRTTRTHSSLRIVNFVASSYREKGKRGDALLQRAEMTLSPHSWEIAAASVVRRRVSWDFSSNEAEEICLVGWMLDVQPLFCNWMNCSHTNAHM